MSEIRRKKIYAGYYDRYNKCNTVKEKGEKLYSKAIGTMFRRIWYKEAAVLQKFGIKEHHPGRIILPG